VLKATPSQNPEIQVNAKISGEGNRIREWFLSLQVRAVSSDRYARTPSAQKLDRIENGPLCINIIIMSKKITPGNFSHNVVSKLTTESTRIIICYETLGSALVDGHY
jgi:hypothetical protein